jgi:hypothetical protein
VIAVKQYRKMSIINIAVNCKGWHQFEISLLSIRKTAVNNKRRHVRQSKMSLTTSVRESEEFYNRSSNQIRGNISIVSQL